MQLSTRHLEKLSPHKELVVTTSVAMLCLLLAAIFPADNAFQSISKNIFFLVALPILYIKLILKNDLSQWGWNLANKKTGMLLAGGAFLVGLVIFFLMINFAGFSSYYVIDPLVKNNFGFFLLYELVFFNLFFFAQEFFFHGFILSAARQFYMRAIFIQSAIYFLTLLFAKTPILQSAPLIYLSLAGGWVTYKTRSFVYSYISGLLFIIILDAYIIHLIK